MEKLTEQIICKELNAKYIGNCKYKLDNAFIFKYDWESDFFVLKTNGYCYEFEIKITRSDFLKDKKKVNKHLILETGMYQKQNTLGKWNSESNRWEGEYKDQQHVYRPNKFFYVVPHGLITVDEIPPYAGLMYVGNKDYERGIYTIKEAPFIHKEILDFEKILCKKFYNRLIDARYKIRTLELEIEYLKTNQNNIYAK